LPYKTTIQDIARELNLTSATISRALHNHPRISEQTKRLVLETANRLHYRRNKIASSLRSGKSHTIGVIIPSAQMNFFGSVVHGIQSLANTSGYSILLYQSEESTELEIKAIEAFLGARVDGILASIAKGTTDFTHFTELKKRGVPLVFFDRTNESLDISSVVINDYKGAYNATEHLIKQGYQRIAHVSGQQHVKGFHDRLLGYQDALKANNIKLVPEFVYQGNISIESGRQATDYFLQLPQPPDAVFAVEDFTAMGVLQQLKKLKISVPGSFGVVGFANESFGEYITPSLSTVDQQTVQMGREAFNMLVEQIEENNVAIDKGSMVILEPVLLCRESSVRVNDC
jgi:LacI family transcriptional regulator